MSLNLPAKKAVGTLRQNSNYIVIAKTLYKIMWLELKLLSVTSSVQQKSTVCLRHLHLNSCS